jgi:hypothetical protein
MQANTHTHTDRQTDRQTHTHTERQTDRQTDRQTGIALPLDFSSFEPEGIKFDPCYWGRRFAEEWLIIEIDKAVFLNGDFTQSLPFINSPLWTLVFCALDPTILLSRAAHALQVCYCWIWRLWLDVSSFCKFTYQILSSTHTKAKQPKAAERNVMLLCNCCGSRAEGHWFKSSS